MKSSLYLFKLTVMLMTCCLLFSCVAKRSVTLRPANEPLSPPAGKIKSKQVDFPAEFEKILNKTKSLHPYSEWIHKVYYHVKYQPILVSRFLPQHGLQPLLDYLEKSGEHGLDTNLFQISLLKDKLAKLDTTKSTYTVEEYRNLTKLELAVATAFIRYSMILQYGLVNPKEIYPDYDIPTVQADSIAIAQVFNVKDLNKYLDSIQPKAHIYLALQKALNTLNHDPSKNTIESRKTLIVNLERLRWKNKPTEQKYVSVNIANCSLDVLNGQKSILNMKVCVGEKGSRQTPQIGSMIYRIQVNPVWNIPQSIVNEEISKLAAQDRYYLANNNINVYKKGLLIENSESINWSSSDLSEYSFQQQPGPENALGKIKFLFDNKNSVYLHDTPLQKIFTQKNRAVSHGCIRVEKPLELAYVLFGKGQKYQFIKKAMHNGYPRAKFLDLPTQVPIRLHYYTIGILADNTIRYYTDIYDLDPILYQAIKDRDLSY